MYAKNIVPHPLLKVTLFDRKDVVIFMAKAKKLPSGSWRIRVFSHKDKDGKAYYESFTAPTKKEAEYMAAEFQQNKDRMSDSRNWTLGEAIDKYIEFKRPILSPSTIQGYEKVRRVNFQGLMDVPLKKITNPVLEKAVRAELERKPEKRKAATMSVKTIKNAYGLISAVLKRYNPGMTYSVEFPKVPRRIRSLPLPEEIYAAVKGSSIELPVLLAMWLSFTESEIRGLTKSKSIDGDYITIREVVVVIDGVDVRKEMAKEETRNRRHRMPQHIKELIDQVDGDVIVPQTPSRLLKGLKYHLKKAGLPEITFHDLRHVNATLMATLQIPDQYAQERGGWKTDHIMKTVYMETFSAERQRIDAIIDGYFFDRLGV